jgi:hypothetical protein
MSLIIFTFAKIVFLFLVLIFCAIDFHLFYLYLFGNIADIHYVYWSIYKKNRPADYILFTYIIHPMSQSNIYYNIAALKLPPNVWQDIRVFLPLFLISLNYFSIWVYMNVFQQMMLHTRIILMQKKSFDIFHLFFLEIISHMQDASVKLLFKILTFF